MTQARSPSRSPRTGVRDLQVAARGDTAATSAGSPRWCRAGPRRPFSGVVLAAIMDAAWVHLHHLDGGGQERPDRGDPGGGGVENDLEGVLGGITRSSISPPPPPSSERQAGRAPPRARRGRGGARAAGAWKRKSDGSMEEHRSRPISSISRTGPRRARSRRFELTGGRSRLLDERAASAFARRTDRLDRSIFLRTAMAEAENPRNRTPGRA